MLGHAVAGTQPALAHVKAYDSIVVYGHSTGALVAAMYAIDGTFRQHISGCAQRAATV